jgi:hypothetical protein
MPKSLKTSAELSQKAAGYMLAAANAAKREIKQTETGKQTTTKTTTTKTTNTKSKSKK